MNRNNQFSLDQALLDDATSVPSIESHTSYESVYLPNCAELAKFIHAPEDGSLIKKFCNSKFDRKKLTDAVLEETLNFMLAETVDIKYYLLSRLFCSTNQAASIARTNRRNYSSVEWYEAASSGLDSKISDTKGLLKRLKSILMSRPELLSVASSLVSRFRK